MKPQIADGGNERYLTIAYGILVAGLIVVVILASMLFMKFPGPIFTTDYHDIAPADVKKLAMDSVTPGYCQLEIFYATDRELQEKEEESRWSRSRAKMIIGFIAVILAPLLLLAGRWTVRRLFGWLALASFGAGGVYLVWGLLLWINPPLVRGPAVTYGSGRADDLSRGFCLVSIPKDHRMGQLESPSMLRFEINEDPEKHVVLLDVQPQEKSEFFQGVNGRLDLATRRDLLVYIHGYNVSFEDAARQTAQIAYDLDFPGVPILFSWPSRGDFAQYTRDETNAQWAVPDLAAFLREVTINAEPRAVHLIAHSMGNRCLIDALDRLRAEGTGIPRSISEVILTAPDIDAETFRKGVPRLLGAVGRVTLYASSRDRALMASKEVWGYARAGESGEGLVVVPPMETVDATEVDTSLLGHSYFREESSVLADLFYLVRDRLPAGKRFGMRSAERGGKAYWVFKPR